MNKFAWPLIVPTDNFEVKLAFGKITLVKSGNEFVQPIGPVGYVGLGTVIRTNQQPIKQLGCIHTSLLTHSRLCRWGIMTYQRKRDLLIPTKTLLWTPEQFLHQKVASIFFLNIPPELEGANKPTYLEYHLCTVVK
jgi:hypothetical protein